MDRSYGRSVQRPGQLLHSLRKPSFTTVFLLGTVLLQLCISALIYLSFRRAYGPAVQRDSALAAGGALGSSAGRLDLAAGAGGRAGESLGDAVSHQQHQDALLSQRHQKLEEAHQGLKLETQLGSGSSGAVNQLQDVQASGHRLEKELRRWYARVKALDAGASNTLQSLLEKLPGMAYVAAAAGHADAQTVVGQQKQSAVVSSAGGGAEQCMPNGHLYTTMVPPPPQYMMRPAAEIAKEHPELAELAARYANNKREIMLTLTNGVMICQNATICWWNGGNILKSFLEVLERANIRNHLIGCMDSESDTYLADYQQQLIKAGKGFRVNWFTPKVEIPKAQVGTRGANQVSALKFTLIQELMQLGYHVLITDMDLVYIKNPFDHLYRDADIESSSDGFDSMAYGQFDGIHDPTMGWGGGGLYMKTFTINVGCAYIRATHRAFHLVKSVAEHLAREPGWDQQVFNQHLLTLSHGTEVTNPYATLRIMDIQQFVNSKTFFRSYRHQYIPGAKATAATPVMVHFNYHPDKHKRMMCIMDRYFYGKLDACDAFPGGSEPNT